MDRVKAGEDVVITEHGKVVARIIKEGARKQPIRAALEPLIGRGLIAPPTQDLIRHGLKPLAVPGKPVFDELLKVIPFACFDQRLAQAVWEEKFVTFP